MPVKFNGVLDKDAALMALHRAAKAFRPEREPPYVSRETLCRVAKIAYLPVEIAARELASKAWLAGELARRGWEVILGASWLLQHNNYADLPPGVILFKTMNFFDGCLMYHARENGHLVACLNEELFALKPELSTYEIECHPVARFYTDFACAHGQAQAGLYAGLLPDTAKVVVTGNPRANKGAVTPGDRGPLEGEALVCLMAGNCNGILPVEQYMGVTFRALNRNDPKILEFLEAGIEAECTNHPLIIERANALEAEGWRVRVRPHPVENPALYEVSGNCILDDRTSIGERLRNAARCVFVSGCATGVDACLAGVPTERIGFGGHGLSGVVPESIRAEFSAGCTLADDLDNFQAGRNMGLRMSAARAFGLRAGSGAAGWGPSGFHRAKFPEPSLEDVGRMTGGAVVKQLGWNLWSVTA